MKNLVTLKLHLKNDNALLEVKDFLIEEFGLVPNRASQIVRGSVLYLHETLKQMSANELAIGLYRIHDALKCSWVDDLGCLHQTSSYKAFLDMAYADINIYSDLFFTEQVGVRIPVERNKVPLIENLLFIREGGHSGICARLDESEISMFLVLLNTVFSIRSLCSMEQTVKALLQNKESYLILYKELQFTVSFEVVGNSVLVRLIVVDESTVQLLIEAYHMDLMVLLSRKMGNLPWKEKEDE